ncbi:hypothetical protein EV360DRAFT_74139 [Lentinula raphanica]|nr:hypothetical protein EV360DRAFT_74139 [Lentinula raphanica]
MIFKPYAITASSQTTGVSVSLRTGYAGRLSYRQWWLLGSGEVEEEGLTRDHHSNLDTENRVEIGGDWPPLQDLDLVVDSRNDLLQQVRPLLQQVEKIMDECQGMMKGADPENKISSRAKRHQEAHRASPEEQNMIEEVGGTIEWARDKLDSFPKAKRDLGSLVGLDEPIVGDDISHQLVMVQHLLESHPDGERAYKRDTNGFTGHLAIHLSPSLCPLNEGDQQEARDRLQKCYHSELCDLGRWVRLRRLWTCLCCGPVVDQLQSRLINIQSLETQTSRALGPYPLIENENCFYGTAAPTTCDIGYYRPEASNFEGIDSFAVLKYLHEWVKNASGSVEDWCWNLVFVVPNLEIETFWRTYQTKYMALDFPLHPTGTCHSPLLRTSTRRSNGLMNSRKLLTKCFNVTSTDPPILRVITRTYDDPSGSRMGLNGWTMKERWDGLLILGLT